MGPGTGNKTMTKIDRPLLSWNSQSIVQWNKWTGHVLVWCNRCQSEGNQDVMGAHQKSTTSAWGRMENQRRHCKGSSVLTGTWRVYCISKRRGGECPKPCSTAWRGAERRKPLRNWEVQHVRIVLCETGRMRINKKKQRRTFPRIRTWASGPSVVPFAEMRCSGGVGLEEGGVTMTRVWIHHYL